MKASLILAAVAFVVSVARASEVILPSQTTPRTTTQAYAHYQHQHQHKSPAAHQNGYQHGAAVNVQTKITAPQTGPIVHFSHTSFNQGSSSVQTKPVSWSQPTPTVNIKYEEPNIKVTHQYHEHQHHVSQHKVRVIDDKFQYGGSGSYQTSNHQQDKSFSKCSPPRDTLSVNWDESVSKGTWYFPLIHKSDLGNYNRLVYGRELRSSDNVNNLCLRNQWTWRESKVTILGQNERSTSGPISCQKVGNSFDAVCTSSNHFGETSFKFFAVKSDNKNYVLAYTCWDSGETGWTLLSNTPTVSYQLKQEVNTKVRSLGFNAVDTYEVFYESCAEQQEILLKNLQQTFALGQGPSHQNHFGQRPAVTPFTQTQNQHVSGQHQHSVVETETKYANCKPPSDYQLLDLEWNSDKENVYFPLTHTNNFNNYFRNLFGNDLRSDENPNSACLYNKWDTEKDLKYITFKSESHGTRSSAPVGCTQIGSKWAYECTVEGNSFQSYTVAGDKQSWFLGYACWESGVTGWTLYSTTPTVTNQIKQEVLRKVKTLGFSSDDYLEINYDGCVKDEVKTKSMTSQFQYQRQQENRYVQKPISQTSTFVQKPVVQTNTFVQKPVVQTNSFVQKPFVQTTTFVQKPIQATTFVQKPFVQAATFAQKPVVQTNAFVQKPFVQATTFVQKPIQATTFVQKPFVQTNAFTQTHSNHETFGVHSVQHKATTHQQTTYSQTKGVYSGIYSRKYQHCGLPSLTDIADSPLSESAGVKQSDASLQEQYFYFPLSQRTTLSNFNKLIFGKALFSGEQVNPLCYGSKFAWTGRDKDIVLTFYSKGQFNNRSSEQVTCRQEDSTKWLGECISNSGESFLAYVVKDDFKESEAHGFIGNFCWESGTKGWNFFSTEQGVSQEDKAIVLREVARLGYGANDYVDISYERCPADLSEKGQQTRFFNKNSHLAQLEFEYGAYAEGSATVLYPNCKPPTNYLRSDTWESSTYRDGVEYWDRVILSSDEPLLLNKVLNYRGNLNLRRDKDSLCYRERLDWSDHTYKFIGYGNVVSPDPIRCSQKGSESVYSCISKNGNSFKKYIVKSDNRSWSLLYSCWESGKQTWSVATKPGTVLSANVKSNILQEVETMGFNSRDHIELDHTKCEFNRNLFSGYEQDCNCCKVNKF